MAGKKIIRVMDAVIPLKLNIEKRDFEVAKPGDMDNCVVAKAITRQLGTVDICVSSKIISVLKGDILIRFRTPQKIAKNLPIFDKTGCWSLPFGTYKLLPPTASTSISARKTDKKRKRPTGPKKTTKSTNKVRPLHSRESSKFKAFMKKTTDVRYFS